MRTSADMEAPLAAMLLSVMLMMAAGGAATAAAAWEANSTADFVLALSDFALALADDSEVVHVNIIPADGTVAKAAKLAKKVARIKSVAVIPLPDFWCDGQNATVKLNMVLGACHSKSAVNVTAADRMMAACRVSNVWAFECPEEDHVFFNDSSLSEGIRLDSDVFVFTPMENGKTSIFELYRIKKEQASILLEYGNWSSAVGLSLDTADKYERRRDLRGAVVKTVLGIWKPYMNFYTNESTGEVEFEGFFADVYMQLSRMLNFSYTFVLSPDNSWGAHLANGSWTGMIGMLDRKEVDIMAAGLLNTYDRGLYVDFAPDLIVGNARIFIRNPNINFNFLAYLTPLRWDVWFTMVLFLIFLPFVITLSAHLPPQDTHVKEFTLYKSFIYVFGAVTFSRRWSVTPFTLSTRVIFFLIAICGVVIQGLWKAGIISQLTVRTWILPFTDLEGLAESDYTLVLYPTGVLNSIFSDAEPGTIEHFLYNRDVAPVKHTRPGDTAKLRDFTMTGDYAFLSYEDQALQFSDEYARCDILAIGRAYFRSVVSYGLVKDSPFTGIFSYHLNVLKERGVFSKTAIYYKYPKPNCGGGKGTPVGLNNAISAFLILGWGMIATAAFFVAEHFVKLTYRIHRARGGSEIRMLAEAKRKLEESPIM